MTGNDFMSWVLRSPAHGMLSNTTMLITVTGCRSGKKLTLPVNYYRQDGHLYVLTYRNRTWWRNVQNGERVSLLLQRQTVDAFAEAELENHAVEELLCEYLKHIPQAARSLGVRMESGIPNPEDIQRAAKDKLFVKFSLN